MDKPEWYLPIVSHNDDPNFLAKMRRAERKILAQQFLYKYKYGGGQDKITCIWSGGGDFSWRGDSSGVTWVGVRGNDSICVVTKAKDLDVTHVHGWLIFYTKEEVLRLFRRTIISEIEDIADPSSKLREMLVQSIKPPFGVVSVKGGHERGHESDSKDGTLNDLFVKNFNSSEYDFKEDKYFQAFLEEFNRQSLQAANGEIVTDEHEPEDAGDEDAMIKNLMKMEAKEWRSKLVDEKKIIKFLQEELKRDPTTTINEINETVEETTDEETTSGNDGEKRAIEFLQDKMKTVGDLTSEETIKIAISAFQHLFKKKLNADDIEVCVLDPKDPVNKDIEEKDLDKSEIKHHLAEIYVPGSGGSVLDPLDPVNSDTYVKELKRSEIKRRFSHRLAEAKKSGGSKKQRLDYHL